MAGKHPPLAEMCVPGMAPGKKFLGRCGHQEGDVPKNVVPREETFSRRSSHKANVFGKEMSLKICHSLEGNIPSEDVPGKVSLGR